MVDGAPWCGACVALLQRPTPRSLVALVVGVVVAASIVLATALRVGAPWMRGVGVAVVALLAIFGARRALRAADAGRSRQLIAPRWPPPAAAVVPAGPYRGSVARVARRVVPPVSGALTALLTTLALVVTAAVVPVVFSLPRWLELELIVAGWFAVLATLLTVALYRGWRFARDAYLLRRGTEVDPGSSTVVSRGCSSPWRSSSCSSSACSSSSSSSRRWSSACSR